MEYALFEQRFPELATVDSSRQALINVLLQEAEADANQGLYGTKWARAVLLLAAHRYTLQNRAAGGLGSNDVQSLSVSSGSHSVTFAQPQAQESDLNATVYGRLLLSLQRSLPLTGFVI